MKRVAGVVATLAALALVATAIVASLAWRDESLRPTRVSRDVIWHHVENAPEALRRTEKFTVRRDATVDLLSPGWTGTVTAVALRAGDVLDASSPPPLAVDGIGRAWFVADAPLFRAVGSGASGRDVDDLAAFLQRSGQEFAHELGRPVDATMLAAIRNWAAWLGFGKRVASFDPQWVTWLPADQIGARVAAVEVDVGDPAPGQGDALASIGGAPTSVVPVEDVSAPAEVSPLRFDGVAQVLVVGDARLPFDGGVLSDDDLARLGDIVPSDQDEFTATVEQSIPAGAQALSASALLPTAQGFCAVVADDDRGTGARAMAVRVIGASAGAAIVEAVGAFVAVNPDASDVACV